MQGDTKKNRKIRIYYQVSVIKETFASKLN